MSSPDRFKPYQPDVQAVVRLEEALPPEHPIHVFVDLVQGVDLRHFVIPPGPKGEKPYHPHALFGILAWGYLHGVRSARKLARLARQEATFVYLAGGGQPNYRTLARFRRDNAEAFTAVFQETVVLALRLGLARLGHVALDGTKLKANTSKHKAMSYGRMRQREAQLKDEIARLVEQAESQDTAEDQEYGSDSDGYSVAEELARREARLAKIQAAREHLEAEQRAEQGVAAGDQPVIADKEQRSFADDDARIMLMKRGGYDYAYNAQAVVDAESGVIVAAVLTNVAPDMRHLPELVTEVRTLRDGVGLLDHQPTTVSADAGYFSGENAAEDRDGLDLLIAAGRDDPAAATTKATVFAIDRFGYDPTRDVWVCPANKLLGLQVTPPGATGRPSTNQYRAAAADCADCPFRTACLKPDEDHRVLQAKDRRSAGAMRYKLRQPDARRRYARRKTIVEPVFGQLKEARGFATLSLRGLTRAAGEYLLACLAHNLGKLLRVCPLPVARVAPLAA
jgi:transposase